MELAMQPDKEAALAGFDETFFSHLGFVCTNAARAFIHGLSRSLTAPAPSAGSASLRRQYQHVNRLSAAFALAADMAMFTMQASLKRREMISGRLGDLLSMLYLASMVLKHHEDQNAPAEDLPVVEWCCAHLLNNYQQAMHELLDNLPNRLVAILLRVAVFPTGRHFEKPSDRLEAKVAELVTRNTATRRRLIEGVYLTAAPNNPLGRVNELLASVDEIEPLERKLREAVKAGTVEPLLGIQLIEAGTVAGVLNADEAKRMRDWDARVMDIIHVDEFEYGALARESMPEAAREARRAAPGA
jgi:acyl-CoA dehydrogenase